MKKGKITMNKKIVLSLGPEEGKRARGDKVGDKTLVGDPQGDGNS